MIAAFPPFALALVLFWSTQTMAAESRLADFLGKTPLTELAPQADHLGPISGTPPAAAAFAGEKQIGYVYLNSDVVNATGYSGRPIHLLVGIDMAGTITGAKLVEHHEPIVLIGIPEQKIKSYIDGFIGSNPSAGTFPAGKHGPDIISGATVTVMVLGDTLTKSAIAIAKSRKLGPYAGQSTEAVQEAPQRRIDPDKTGEASWQELLGDGSVRRLHLSVADINQTFARAPDPRAGERPEAGPDDDSFIDLYVALASAPVIGRSLLGEKGFADLRQRLGDDRQVLLVMGDGRYSFRGSGYVRGGIFDRIQLIQGQNTVRFRDHDYQRVGKLAPDDAPAFPEIGLFALPVGSDVNMAEEWRLTLLVQRAVGALEKVFVSEDLPYQLPDKYLLAAPQTTEPATAAAATRDSAADEPLWMKIWQQRTGDIAILGTALVILTLIFFFQDWLVRRPRLAGLLRSCFLLFTLLWIGWYADAQMSVVNILAVANALLTGFRWDYFLMDPLIFILWCATAASLLFWGRGAYCGWLCPFGALQEFANRLARRLKVPQLLIPWAVHERLWPIKYIVFLGLFGFSVYSLGDAERLAEIEPFKTAIILKFVRHWPFVLYAVVLLGGSLFVERLFCRYLCPLGAALAIPARIRMFDWLKRYRECGNPCQRCANECPVQAIHPDGRINPNECIYCMHCQELYWDDHRCPVMIGRRIKRERQQNMSAPPPLPTAAIAKPGTNPTKGDDHHGQ
ncbi:4Fe-4S binding protein [Telmatospirillum sp.]|uniref:4Fe-4S binding protein n=1 Tax=Telmatospirillum sp. TaxID=2079197 RepID=UPI0028405F13|nr:4Fe-4S binding protein [Telmatospirillum sp.]MDR3439371.1 4Fe-4S binding protein [Telmatospirillum sp.]